MNHQSSNHVPFTRTVRALTLLALLSTINYQLNSQLSASPLGSAFTYQGKLADGGNPAGGSYDLQFTLYDAATNGNLVAGPITNSAVGITNGLFTVALDFGASPFNGDARWLEIGVRTNGSPSGFTLLAPLQPLTPTPYALQAAQALRAAGFAGNGAGITNLDADALASGTVPDARLSSDVMLDGGPNLTRNDYSGYSSAIATANATNGLIRVALIGDSYIGQGVWTPILLHELAIKYGNGGIGYQTGNAGGWDILPCSLTGAWTTNTFSTNFFSLTGMSSANAGATYSLTYASDAAKVIWGGAVGQFTITTNGTTWGTITTAAGGGATNIVFSDRLSHIITITVNSGTVKISGMSFYNNSGIVFDHLSEGGTDSTIWSSINPAIFTNCLSGLAPDLVIIMLGAKDVYSCTANIPTFSLNMSNLIVRVQAACPQASVLLIGPASIAATCSGHTLEDYSLSLLPVARSLGVDLLELRDSFGSYAEANARGLFNADTVHPSTLGYRLIAESVYRKLTGEAMSRIHNLYADAGGGVPSLWSTNTSTGLTIDNGATALDVDIVSAGGNSYAWLQHRLHNGDGLNYYSLCFNPLGGYVAVGRTNPATALDVKGYITAGNGSGSLLGDYLLNLNHGLVLQNAAGYTALFNGANYLSVSDYGVGIGNIPYPSAALQVNGGILCSSIVSTNGVWMPTNVAAWPATASSPGAAYWGNSNSFVYLLQSGVNSTTWVSTNLIGKQ